MKSRRIDTRASRTAAYTCVSRAGAYLEKDIRFRGPDHLAEIFLPMFAKLILRSSPLRKLFVRKTAPPGIYEYVLARTKVLDQVFVQALESGFVQIVLLGAGFDTRALRFADQNRGTKVYELDVATTQQPKIEILKRKNVRLPAELVFVSIDFNKEQISEVLSRVGYQEGKKSLFIWEGVTMYLSRPAVDGTLDFICRRAAPGSLLAFDYIYASVLRQENCFYGEQEIFKTVSKAGEGWTFGLEAGEVVPFLSERGFEVLAQYTPSDLEKAFLIAENGDRFGRINGTHCIVVAAVRDDTRGD
jgi:methyltransferase (TIGR00027 family)